jgi:hypothetical protein
MAVFYEATALVAAAFIRQIRDADRPVVFPCTMLFMPRQTW